MGSTVIGEPFQLYVSSSAAQKFHNFEAVYASNNPDFPGYATVTAQSEGIHVWDLHNLHAVASYAVDTHIRFAIPAFSLYVTQDGNKSVITYALVGFAPGLSKEERGRTLWVIRQCISGSAPANDKTVVPLDIQLAQICGTGHPTVPLLFVSQDGSLFLMDERAKIKNQHAWRGQYDHVETFVFPRKSCTFIQDDTHPCNSVAVTCCRSRTNLHVRLALLGDEIIPLGTCEIPIASSANTDAHLLCLTCSPSGILSLFTSRAKWTAYQLVSVNSSLVSNPIAENLHLCRLAILRVKNPSTAAGISLVSLGTSLVLLAALVEGSPNISLQIWDLSYGVVLATQSIPIPFDFSFVHLNLAVAGKGQALLTVSPGITFEKDATPKRSSIHIVPVEAHIKSNIATALGKTALTAKWLVPKTSYNQEDGESAEIISKIRRFLEKRNVLKAEQAFLKWVDSHSSKETALGYEFVRKLFNIVLIPDQLTKYPYAPRITRCLLENAVVSTIMLNGRLITILRERGDWENLMFALKRVRDVSEDELMASAKFLVDRQRKIKNAMDTDVSGGYVPPLWSYLFACVSYPFSVAPMRLAIRKHLPDAQDLVMILEILEAWIQGGTEYEVEVLLKTVVTNTTMSSSQADAPPYPKIITFVHALLDASFVALLQYEPAHELLRRVLSYIEPEIAFMDSLELLRGMLEPFAKAQLKIKMDASSETPVEQRERRKQVKEQASLSVGLYRLEELAI